MSYKLRPRQEIAVKNMVDFVNNKKKDKGIFIYPTSFGKSLVISNVASKFPDKYFINVTNSKELVSQNYEKYISYGFEADLCSASLKSNSVGKVTFATIGTLVQHLNFFKDKDVIILDDECHSGSKVGSQLGEFIKKIPKCKLIGTTASPFRLSGGMDGTTLKMMNRDRECIYKSIEDVVQIKEVIDEGYWSKLIYQQKVVDESSLELNGSGTDFTVESLKAFGENNNIVDRCIEEAKILIAQGRKSILISVPFIEDARRIESKLESCKSVYSGMKASERDSIISDFKALKITVVAQVSLLSIGFDHPEMDGLIMAKPSNSLTFVYQLIGRLVRIHPDKKDAIIVDLSGNISKFGKVEDITIETNDYTSGWAVFSKDDLLTGYPLNTTRRPNRKSLQAKLQRKQKGLNNPDPKFYFGKYKDKLVSEVYKENKSYLTWLLDQKDFKWYGEVGTNLKKAIRIVLGLEVLVESAPKEKVNTKQLLEDYTNSIRTLQDLKDIW